MISTKVILIVAIVVFVFMLIGLVLTMREFDELTDEAATRESSGGRGGPSH